ncbi:MAG: DUF2339 domain-containing protein [Treponema sp.]|nr:DUF2339 domain-containing protein [Treponema sp.]
MTGIIFLIAGAFIFAVTGVIGLLIRTSSQAELLREYERRIVLLEESVKFFVSGQARFAGPQGGEGKAAADGPFPAETAAGEPVLTADMPQAAASAADTPVFTETIPAAGTLDGTAADDAAEGGAAAGGARDVDYAEGGTLDGAAAAGGVTAGNTAAVYAAGEDGAGVPADDGGIPAGGDVPGGAPPALLTGLIGFIHGGNLWAAGGVVFFIAGFATFITWLARRGFFTIEMGIAAAALSGLVMLGAGWRLRKKRRVYFLLLQGGGIGILYLSVFAANRLTPWFPVSVTLILLSFLILPAVFLALLQRAQALAFFGFLGGYAAPILLSSGGGNHLFLFSYYLVLNLGILIIGYFRFWKGLNLLAFCCTFTVSLGWIYGRTDIGRSAVLSAEPFFLAYILLFTLLGLHAIRRRDGRDGRIRPGSYIEWGLIFGTPLLGALIQWRVFSYVEHGYAIASIAFSAFYLFLAFIIRKFKTPAIFVEGYLGLSVLLANLAIPLELSSRITSAVWAAEGAVVYFLGLRFRRRKVWIAALILQAAAALAFVPEMEGAGFGDSAYRSPRFTGALVIALSALVIVLLTRRLFPRNGGVENTAAETGGTAKTTGQAGAAIAGTAEGPGAEENTGGEYAALTVTFTLWGCAWWFGAWLYECLRTAAEPWPLFFIVSSASALLFFGISKIFRCAILTAGAVPSLCCALALCLSGLGGVVRHTGGDPLSFTLIYFNYFEGLYLQGWAAFFTVQILILLLSRKDMKEKIHATWFLAVILIAAMVLSLSGRYLTVRFDLSESWTSFAGLLPLFVILILTGLLRPRFNPPPLHRTLVFSALPLFLCIILGIWFTVTLFMPGNPDPHPLYLPVLNPLDLEELFCIVLFLLWQNSARRAGDRGSLSRGVILTIADGALFLVFTAVIARGVHFYGRIPYGRVPGSEVFQLCLFVFWAIWGVAHIIGGNRMKFRRLWIAGAILTVTDIAKLLILDLAGSGTAIRIISFFIAGFILLFIGWASPLPPAPEKTAAGEAEKR